MVAFLVVGVVVAAPPRADAINPFAKAGPATTIPVTKRTCDPSLSRLGSLRPVTRARPIPFADRAGQHRMDPIKEMYDRWAAGDMGSDDQWGDVTAEPRGVDYLEVSANGVPAMWLDPHGAAADRVIMAIHGGGFIGGSLYTHRKMYGHLAKAAGVRVLLTTYRLAPRFPYPAQIDDAVTAYRWVADQGFTTALTGDSSGGGL